MLVFEQKCSSSQSDPCRPTQFPLLQLLAGFCTNLTTGPDLNRGAAASVPAVATPMVKVEKISWITDRCRDAAPNMNLEPLSYPKTSLNSPKYMSFYFSE